MRRAERIFARGLGMLLGAGVLLGAAMLPGAGGPLRAAAPLRTGAPPAVGATQTAGAGVAAADGTAAGIIDACAASIKPPAVAVEALATQCPELESALGRLGFAETLAPGWQTRLTRAQLDDLGTLARRYDKNSKTAAPDVGAVHGVLAGLVHERVPERKSWWARLVDWVRSWSARHDDGDLSWLQRWLDKLSSTADVFSAIATALVALILIGAALYIVREVRSAGLFERARAPAGPAGGAPGGTPDGLAGRAFEHASLLEQPALLLALLVRSLMRSGRLAAERHLTHRELIERAALDDPSQKARLARVAGIAEEVLYGARQPEAPALEDAIEGGRELLRQLDRQAGASS